MSTVSFLTKDALPPQIAGHTIAPNFVGFSMEQPCIGPVSPLALNGSPNKGLINAMNILLNSTLSSFPFALRIGGDSQDWLWYEGTVGVNRGANTSCVVNSDAMQKVSSFYSQLAVPVSVSMGVSMASASAVDRTSMAVQFLRGAVLPNWKQEQLTAIEPGNEPEYFVKNQMRPGAPYDIFQSYPSEWVTFTQELQSTLGQSFSFIGPATSFYSGSPGITILQRFLALKPQVSAITMHYYAENSQASKDAQVLLQSPTDNTTFDFLASVYQPGQKYILGETNSRSNGGAVGVSNVYASALWALDHLATSAWSGFSGAWFHKAILADGNFTTIDGVFVTDSGSYAPIVVNPKNVAQFIVRPEFYGMLGFSRALRWVGTANIQVIRGGGANVRTDAQNGIKYFAFLDPKDSTWWSVILINKSGTAKSIAFGLPDGCSANSTGRIEFIQQSTSDISAVTGVSIGGQTFDGSLDGNLLGLYSTASIALKNGLFSLNLPAHSAAIIYMSNSSLPRFSNSATDSSSTHSSSMKTHSFSLLLFLFILLPQ